MRAMAILLLLCGTALGQNTIDIPNSVVVGEKVVAHCNCVPPDNGDLIIMWNWSSGLDVEQVDGGYLHIWGKPGRHKVDAIVLPVRTINYEGEELKVLIGNPIRLDASLRITSGDDDGDDDDDDDDDDDGTELPFSTPVFSVMIVKEVKDSSKLPPAQLSVLNSPRVLKWLEANCGMLQRDGGDTPAYRLWDDDYTASQMANVHPVLRGAYDHVKGAATELPWIAIVNPERQAGFTGPLPDNVDETIALLEKYR